jgi:hypothetical protein
MYKTRMRTICCKLDVEGHDATLAAPLAVTQRAAIASAASGAVVSPTSTTAAGTDSPTQPS